MSVLSRLRAALGQRWRSEDGAVTVEFAIVVPFVLGLLFMAIDSGIVQLRQVYLHRAVDLAVREVRLGRVSESERMSELICDRTTMLPNCRQRITVEMLPIDTAVFSGLNGPVTCVDREEEITPALAFNPGSGQQELMLVRVCVVADPFISFMGYVNGLPRDQNGDYVLIANSVFVNEPR